MAEQQPEKLRRREALRRGTRAEGLAALWLRLRGWRIVQRNFRCRQGEIDIIARKGNLVIFVEVKARTGLQQAVVAVDASSQRRISAAGMKWIAARPDGAELSWRCDIVAVRPWRLPVHLEDAFASPIAY